MPRVSPDDVLERLRKKRPERTKRTLVLTRETYDEFERLCRKQRLYPSEVVDEFIALFVERSSSKGR